MVSFRPKTQEYRLSWLENGKHGTSLVDHLNIRLVSDMSPSELETWREQRRDYVNAEKLKWEQWKRDDEQKTRLEYFRSQRADQIPIAFTVKEILEHEDAKRNSSIQYHLGDRGNVITIYINRSFRSVGVDVNWSALGSVSIEFTEAFILALQDATCRARKERDIFESDEAMQAAKKIVEAETTSRMENSTNA